MKEQFRDKIPKGKIKVKYFIDKDKGIFDYFITTAEKLFSDIDTVLIYYDEIDIKLTNRQLYYQLVGKALIPNAIEVYKKICTFLTDERYAGKIDWDILEDRDRIPEKHAEWDSVKDIVESAIYSYRLPRWKDQDYYVEIYCEKKAGVSILKPIADKYHVYFGFNKGYSSASAMYDLANRLREKINEGKKAVILYFGDHDPSGLDMVRDINDRITEFLEGGDDPIDTVDYSGSWSKKMFRVVNVALTQDQIQEYSLPPNPAKLTDPRAKAYIKEFGNVSWELDAMDAKKLQYIADDAVLEWLNEELYDAWIQKEKDQKKALQDFARTLK